MAEHWASASTYDSFHQQLKEYIAANKSNPDFKKSFRITVESFNKRIEHKTKVDKIETIAYLPFEGEVKLKDPECEYFYIEFHGSDNMNLPPEPEQIFFGKWVNKFLSFDTE